MTFSKEMKKALEADGEKLRQLTGQNHGPTWLGECPRCDEADERSIGLNKCGLCGCEFIVS